MQATDKQANSNVVDQFSEACQATLDRVLGNNSACVFASVTTLDGRSLAFTAKNDAIRSSRVAALGCSLMSLSEAFSREILQSQCSHNVIATSHGSIITVRLPCKQHQFALSVCVDRSENLAMALRMTLDAAQALADTIDN